MGQNASFSFRFPRLRIVNGSWFVKKTTSNNQSGTTKSSDNNDNNNNYNNSSNDNCFNRNHKWPLKEYWIVSAYWFRYIIFT